MGPRTRIALAAAAIVAVGALVSVAILVFLAPRIPSALDALPEAESGPAPRWAPPVEPPPRAEEPGAGIAGLPDPEWVATASTATGIPERALAAYAGAALVKAEAMPECGMSWPTIAGIAAIESDHGRHGGSAVGADGVAAPPIYGVALDGVDTAHIPDSDGGAIDGDAEYDRAVGPFQLIPQTWRNWHVDADGDGVENPHDIDDAATATVNYLCRAASGAGLALDTEEGWRAAVAAFNSPASYLDAVARAAVRYAEATATLR